MKRRATTQQSVRIDYVCHGVGRVELRRFDPARDSYVALTALLHRAFTPLGAMGLNCTCVDQTVETTRLRATRGDCYVAACNGRIVGTMTLYAPDRESACELYRRDDIASLRQFAVEPVWQARVSLRSWPRFRPPARALTACEIRIERIISRWSLRTRRRAERLLNRSARR